MESQKRNRTAGETAPAFIKYAAVDYRKSSPLYERLARAIARDVDLLKIAEGDDETVPNVFLGAVQYLLSKYPDEPLRQYYPSVTERVRSDDALFSTFRSFCLQHRPEIAEMIRTRSVQTNEVRRAGYLFPSLGNHPTVSYTSSFPGSVFSPLPWVSR